VKETTMDNLRGLVGRTILQARKAPSGELFLSLSGGEAIKLVPYGDCCSHCYIQHVSGADALQGGTVARVEDIASDPTDAERAAASEVVDGFGHRITTNHGVCTIDMRLEHNGYYGGSLDVMMSDGTDGHPQLEDF
jgi:hypothetical protein